MVNGKPKTFAFQIDEDLFQRIKAHLERETVRTGHKLTQREFVLGLIEKALAEAECEAGVSPSKAPVEPNGAQSNGEDESQC